MQELDIYVGEANGTPRRLVQAYHRGEHVYTDTLDTDNAWARQCCAKAILERLGTSRVMSKEQVAEWTFGDEPQEMWPGIADKLMELAAQKDKEAAAKESGEQKPRPTIETVADLLTQDFPDPRYIVENIIPEGVSILASVPKLGKTWLCMGIAVAVSEGGKALGTIDVDGGDVLLLALEDNRRRLKSRFKKILAGQPISRRLHYVTEWPRLDEGGLDEINRWLLEHPDAKLIIIDTLARIRPKRRPNGNLYGEDYDSLSGLAAMAGKYAVAIVVVHHLRKADAVDPFDRMSGSLGLNGAADTLLVLTRARGQSDATLAITGRDVEEQELALRFDPRFCLWSILGDADQFQLSALERAILATFKESPMKPSDVAKSLDRDSKKDKDAIKQAMRRMAAKGRLKALGDGRYAPVTPVTTVTDHEKDAESTEILPFWAGDKSGDKAGDSHEAAMSTSPVTPGDNGDNGDTVTR